MRIISIQDPSRFKDIASGWQSIAVTVAVVIGGAWAAYTFFALRQGELAQQELKKLQIEAQRDARFDFSLDIAAPLTLDAEGRVITGVLVAKNVGSTNAGIKFSTPAITIYRVRFQAGGTEVWEKFRTINLPGANGKPLTGLFGELNATKIRRFAFKVDAPGVYIALVNAYSQSSSAPSRWYFAESNYLPIK